MDYEDKKFLGITVGGAGLLAIGFILAVIATTVLFCVVPTAATIWYNTGYCETQSRLMPDIEFRWELFGGCLMELDDGTWISAPPYLEMRRARLELNGGE